LAGVAQSDETFRGGNLENLWTQATGQGRQQAVTDETAYASDPTNPFAAETMQNGGALRSKVMADAIDPTGAMGFYGRAKHSAPPSRMTAALKGLGS
jgi:hypothetical protein